jgi:hypothetical protein
MQERAFLKEFAVQRKLRYEFKELPNGMSDINVYTDDCQYRYAFVRRWDATGPLVFWILINPGKGDTENRRRPTLERCIEWSRDWNAGGLMIGNLFALRRNKAKELRGVPRLDAVGHHNDAAIKAMSNLAMKHPYSLQIDIDSPKAVDHTIAAWGNCGRLHRRAAEVARLLPGLLCLEVTKAGQPRHPLYVRGNASPKPWTDTVSS